VRPINEVLAEVDDNILLIVVDLLGILDKQFRPCLVRLLNIIVLFNYIKLYKIKLFKKLTTIPSEGRNGSPHHCPNLTIGGLSLEWSHDVRIGPFSQTLD
jgi:hypothetical protein